MTRKRIRHESSPEDAARIVARHLRERLTVATVSGPGPGLPHSVPEIWRRQLTDQAGFEIIQVAALRAVGVPARLDAEGKAVSAGETFVTVRRSRLTLRGEGVAGWWGETTIINHPCGPATSHPR
jgi:hypothetical protein